MLCSFIQSKILGKLQYRHVHCYCYRTVSIRPTIDPKGKTLDNAKKTMKLKSYVLCKHLNDHFVTVSLTLQIGLFIYLLLFNFEYIY